MRSVGVATFGASAYLKGLQKEFEVMKERVVKAAMQQVKQASESMRVATGSDHAWFQRKL